MLLPRLGDFSQQAEAYARSRPGYPDQLIDLLLADIGLKPGDPVAEIGAGTGLFTRQLAGRGLVITALEPNQAMRQRAPVLPGVTWREGTFEETALPTASQRWIVAAQAFHWAEPARALPEAARVLSPGGHLTVLWNDRLNQESTVLSWTEAAIRRVAPDFDECYRGQDWSTLLVSTGDFVDVRKRTVEHAVSMDRDRYLSLWRSHNRLCVLAGEEAVATLLRDLADYLTRERIETVAVPYQTQAWTVRKSGNR